jgi:chemotaxis protein methyltransferase CheR
MSLSKRAGQLEGGNQTKQRHSLLLDVNLSIKAASPSFCTLFHVTPGELLGTKLADLGNGEWNDSALLQMLKALPEKEGEFDDFEMKFDFPASGAANRATQRTTRPFAGRPASGHDPSLH